MRQYTITCPYCFKEFRDDQVHFRMETYFTDETQLNDRGLDEDELAQMADSEEARHLKMQVKRGKRFLMRDDERYKDFWKTYGETTETRVEADSVDSWRLPILNPDDLEDQNVLKELNHNVKGKEKFLTRDKDGMVKSVTDIYGKETTRRVCPICHNPLPDQYGKNDVKFISVIGITSSGKTVYISQLLKHLNKYCSYINMSASRLTDHEREFVRNNQVVTGQPLPASTPTGVLVQPLFYDLLRRDSKDRTVTDTIVIQDIAGEAFKDASFLTKYGRFITKSDGIVLILDPSQLQLVSGQTEIDETPTLVLDTIHRVFVGDSEQACTIPIAVCVSKCDTFSDTLPLLQKDIEPVMTESGEDYLSVFNSIEYNKLEPEIKRLMNPEVKTRLEIQYHTFNYFAFSATGCKVVEKNEIDGAGDNGDDETPNNGKKEYYLAGPPSPKRIAEPVFWLFHQFGYLKSEVPIRLPKKRKAPGGGKVPTGEYTTPGFFDRLRGVQPVEILRDMTDAEKEELNYEILDKARRPR